jgi:hypothetical protein
MNAFNQHCKRLGLVTAAILPLLSGSAQTPASTDSSNAPPPTAVAEPAAPAPATAVATAPAKFSPKVAEVVKLAQSGVGDEVVVAFIKNSSSPYRLGAGDVLALKDAGVPSAVVSAMLARDTALRAKRETAPSNPPSAAPPIPAPPGSAAPGAAGTPRYVYQQKLYGPTSDAAEVPFAAPASPPENAQPALPAQPVAPAQPVPPQAPAAPAPVVVQQPPPPPQVEVAPVAPGPDYYWMPGYWGWRGGAWVWIGGYWGARPYPGAIWLGGHWGRHGRGSVWIGGRWR